MAVTIEEIEAIIRLRDELSKDMNKVDANIKGFAKGSAVQFGFFERAGQKAFDTIQGMAINGARALAGFAQSSVMAAVEATESENLFEVSFGGMADTARKWSEETSAALGINEFELRRNAATLYVMSDSMGVAKDKAYEMATQLTVLAGDMASFYNLHTEDAFAKIQAGISGESEPLKRLGIIVNETTIKHTALEHGIVKTGEKLTEQQKVWARYLTIMDQTQKAQGDLARTIESPANAMRVLTSQFESLRIHIGQAMMPVLRAYIMVQGEVLKTIMENKQAILEWVSQAAVSVVKMVPLLIEGLGKVNTVVSGLIVGYRAFRHGILKTVEFVQKANLAYLKLVGTSEDVKAAQEALAETQRQVNDNAYKAGQTIDGYVARANTIDEFKAKAEALAAEVQKVAENATNASMSVDDMGGSADGTGQKVGTLAEQMEKFLSTLKQPEEIDAIAAYLAEIPKKFEAAFGPSTETIRSNFDEIFKTFAEGNGVMEANDQQLMKAISDMEALADTGELTTDQWNKLGFMYELAMERGIIATEGAITATEGLGTAIVDTLQKSLENLPNVILGAIQGGGDVFAAIGASIGGDLGSTIGKGLTEKLSGALGESLGGAIGGIMGPLGSMVGSLVGKGISALAGKLFGGGEEAKVNDMRDQFFETFGGFEEFSAKMAEVSDEDWAAKIFNAETVEEFNRLVEESGQLLDEHKEKLQLQNEAQELLNDAIDRYGFTLEEMPQKMKQDEIDQGFAQLFQDFELLKAAGFDVSTILSRMGPSINDMVNQAVSAGGTVPAAMKPIIDQMIAEGKLLDENGEAYTSAEEAGITYAQTMSEMFESLIDKVDQLVNALLGINDIDVSPNVNIPSGGGGHNRPDLGAQQGFYSPSMPTGPRPGGGTDIRVHPGEEVSVRPRGAGGGGASEQPLKVIVNIGPEKLYEMITKATKGGQVRVYPDSVKAF